MSVISTFKGVKYLGSASLITYDYVKLICNVIYDWLIM